MANVHLQKACRRAQHRRLQISSRVIVYGWNDGNEMAFGCRSFSRADLSHEVTINRSTGVVTCSCEHATYRLNKTKPTIFDHVCIHAATVLRHCRRIE